MKLRDFLNEQEINQFNELQMELLDAVNQKEQIIIQAKIDKLLDTARSRYNVYLASDGEASSCS